MDETETDPLRAWPWWSFGYFYARLLERLAADEPLRYLPALFLHTYYRRLSLNAIAEKTANVSIWDPIE